MNRWAFVIPVLAAAGCREDGRASSRPPIVLTHASVVLVDSGRVTKDMTVVIDGAVITAVGPTGALTPPRGSQVVDVKGKYVIPGLWDMHAHLTFDGRGSHGMLAALVARGITGVREMGGSMASVRRMRASADSGFLTPRIVAAGRIIDGSLGFADPAWRLNVADSVAAAGAVDSVLAEGADFVKVHDWLARAAYRAIAARAAERRTRLAGHVPIDVGLSEVLDAGQASAEHLGNVYGGYFLDFSRRDVALRRELTRRKAQGSDSILPVAFSASYIGDLLASYDSTRARQLIARMAERHLWQDPTLVLQRANAEGRGDTKDYVSSPQTAAQLRDFFRRQLELVRAMHAAGVPFLAGTDGLTGGDSASIEGLHDELRLFVEAGFTPADALRTATLNPAIFLGLEASAGTVAPGKAADLVLLDANPLDDIANAEKIAAVVRAGRLVRKAEIDSLVNAERAARVVRAKTP
jgi:imidazolonepropionase-like amidohydrolase